MHLGMESPGNSLLACRHLDDDEGPAEGVENLSCLVHYASGVTAFGNLWVGYKKTPHPRRDSFISISNQWQPEKSIRMHRVI